MTKLSPLEVHYLQSAQEGDIDAVRAALADGVNPDVRAADWSTAIMAAAQGGHLDVVKLLATTPGIDINAQNQKCLNPFLYGCITGNLPLVKVMVEAGCELELLTRFGGNGLTPAAEKGHLEVVRYLLENTGINPNHTNTLGWTALIEAIILNDGSKVFQEVVKELLAHGADPMMTDEYGKLPVELAEEREYTEIVEILRAKM